MKKRFSQFMRSVQKRFIATRRRVGAFVERRPLLSFFTLLGVILLLIVISNLIRRPQIAPKTERAQTKSVELYHIGTAPKMTVQAQTNKSGVIQIMALSAGVVQQINYREGDFVPQGAVILSLSSNYQGGNTFSLQRQIAQTQYRNVLDTYQTQKDIITKQIEQAHKTDENSDKLRDITNQSLDDTRSLISLNETILSSIDTQLRTLQQNPEANASLILSTQQLKSQFLSALSATRSTLKANEYQSNGDNPPGILSDVQKNITLKQIDLQAKQLDLNKELSKLQLQIAQVNEASMYPAAPFNATIQKVFVNVGESVGPNTPLMLIAQAAEYDPTTAVAYVPQSVANRISKLEPSILHVGNTTIEAKPTFVSTEAVQGSLYAVYYTVPNENAAAMTNKGFITVDIPVGYYETGATVPFVPLDAVYQTSKGAYVFVANNGKAKSRPVTLDEVYGRFVQVRSGLQNGDNVIVNRNVIDGDSITTSK